MPEYPAEWRRALEMIAGSDNGCSALLLLAQGFASTLIAGLVDSGLATSRIERVWAGGRTVEMMRLRITDRGRVVLER